MSAPAVAVRERPILLSGPMVRAILDGRKSQTRRVMNPQPAPWGTGWEWHTRQERISRGGFGIADGNTESFARWVARHAPYGQPGDRLWVRETFDTMTGWDGGRLVTYRADMQDDYARRERWRPSIHMPRWASRLTLEVTGVRVERVQAITEADARAEGARHFDAIPDQHPYGQGARWSMGDPARTDECLGTAPFAFANLWNQLNAARGHGWDANPWVWVIEFARVDA